MKSIEDTLNIIQDIIKNFPGDLEMALIGGYAAVLHGVERTTLDMDFLCLFRHYSLFKRFCRFFQPLIEMPAGEIRGQFD